MKQFLLPVALLCFTMFAFIFIHIDNMDRLDKANKALDLQYENSSSQPTKDVL